MALLPFVDIEQFYHFFPQTSRCLLSINTKFVSLNMRLITTRATALTRFLCRVVAIRAGGQRPETVVAVRTLTRPSRWRPVFCSILAIGGCQRRESIYCLFRAIPISLRSRCLRLVVFVSCHRLPPSDEIEHEPNKYEIPDDYRQTDTA